MGPRPWRRGAALGEQLLHKGLRPGHGQPPLHHRVQGFAPFLAVCEPQQRPSVALGEAAVQYGLPFRRGELQKPQLVGHRALGPAQPGRRLLLGKAVPPDEPGNGLRLLEAVQIPPLHVLNEGQ